MNSHVNPLDHIGGLSHLVEAASTLSKLSDVNLGKSMGPSSPTVPTAAAAAATTTTTTTTTTSTTTPGTGETQATVMATKKLIVSDDEGDSKSSQRRPMSSSTMRDTFPQRLMELLMTTTTTTTTTDEKNKSPYQDIISWLPHGRAFVVLRPDVFSEKILPHYFFQCTDSRPSTKYPSFTRKLNRWGFRQATRGPDTGAFFHPLFQRDRPQLCLDMVCQKSKKNTNKNNITTSSSTTSSSNKSSHDGNPSHFKSKKRKSPLPAKMMVDVVHGPLSGTGPKQDFPILPSLSHQTCGHVQVTAMLNSEVPLVSPQCPSSPVSTASASSSSTVSSLYCHHQDSIPFPIRRPWSHLVPNDPQLVAKALRERDEAEKLKIAKTMLFQAYLNALQG
jgi:hypothetical protein